MTTERPEGAVPVPGSYKAPEAEKPTRPIDEKVAGAGAAVGAGKGAAIAPQCDMGAVESEGTPLKVQDVVSRVAKEPVKAHRFKEAILRCLESEGVHAGAEITDEVKSRVVKAVVCRLIDDVFRDEAYELKKIHDRIPLKVQLYIFDKCLECQKGESGENTVIAIAKLCAQQDGDATACFIDNFRIDDINALIEIAKLCAQQDGNRTAYFIRRFGINPKNQTALIEIAKLCAQHSGMATAGYIKNFNITDQTVLVEIAKLCAQQDGGATAEYIQDFGITDRNGLVEIAKLCAQQYGGATAEYIKNFGITDQNVLIEIAKLCAQQNGGVTAKNIQKFGITDQSALIEIGAYCVLNSTNYFRGKLELPDYFAKFPDEVQKKLTVFYDEALQPGFLEKCQEESGKSWNFGPELLNITINKEMLVSFLFVFKALDKMRAISSDRVRELMKALMDFRSPSLKPFLFYLFVDVIVSDKLLEFEKFISSVKIPTKAANIPPALMVALTVFTMQNLDPDLKKSIVEAYLKKLGERNSYLPAAPKTGALIEFFQTMNHRVDPVKQKDVCKEFLSFTDSKEYSRKLFVFQAAMMFNIDVVDKTFDQVSELVKQYIRFPEGFGEIFEKLRKRESLLVYIERIQQLPDPDRSQVMQTLRTLMDEVVKGTFIEQRYALSPQLIAMQNLFGKEKWQGLIKEWKGKSSCTVADFLKPPGGLPSQQAVNVRAMFLQKGDDLHFPTDKMPLLSAVLVGSTEVEGEIKKVLQSKDPSQTEQKFDALCARLALSGRLDRQLIQEALDCAPCDWELCNDLQGLLELSKSPLDAFTGYTVVNTDDYWDLFLCGTEVAGSCQRVDGDPQLNKNLLGYVVDGKVRMIAVKDPTGWIAARSIIKLLWDDVGKKPVLFMERIYSNNSQLDEYVTQMARKESARLGIELVTAETAQGRHFLSYPNRSGFEYEDSKDVVQKVPE